MNDPYDGNDFVGIMSVNTSRYIANTVGYNLIFRDLRGESFLFATSPTSLRGTARHHCGENKLSKQRGVHSISSARKS